MATVNGITVERAQAIEDASVVDGSINGLNGHLILTTAGGTTIDAGLVRDDTGLAGHDASTVEHGATGAVVGTTNTQTLSGKTLTSPVINGGTVNSGTLVTPTIASFVNAQHTHTNTTQGGTLAVSATLASFDTSLSSLALGAGDVDVARTIASTSSLIPGKYLILASCRGFTQASGASVRIGWDLNTSSGTLYSGAVVTESDGTLIQGGTSLVGYLANSSNAVVNMTATKLNDSGVLATTSSSGFLVAIRLSDMT